MANKTQREYIPELKKFVDAKGREYINLIAHKMKTSERTVLRWYKQETRPSNAERMLLLRIMQGYNK